ncbi:hypothetical protein ScPMuIL_008285 [Solemya velum]
MVGPLSFYTDYTTFVEGKNYVVKKKTEGQANGTPVQNWKWGKGVWGVGGTQGDLVGCVEGSGVRKRQVIKAPVERNCGTQDKQHSTSHTTKPNKPRPYH